MLVLLTTVCRRAQLFQEAAKQLGLEGPAQQVQADKCVRLRIALLWSSLCSLDTAWCTPNVLHARPPSALIVFSPKCSAECPFRRMLILPRGQCMCEGALMQACVAHGYGPHSAGKPISLMSWPGWRTSRSCLPTSRKLASRLSGRPRTSTRRRASNAGCDSDRHMSYAAIPRHAHC